MLLDKSYFLILLVILQIIFCSKLTRGLKLIILNYLLNLATKT